MHVSFCHVSHCIVIFYLHVKVLACPPVNSLRSGASIFLWSHYCYTGNIEFVEGGTQRGEALAQASQHSTAKSRNQGLGEKREGRWLCFSVLVLLTHPPHRHLPATLPESDHTELPLVAPEESAYLPALFLGHLSHACVGEIWWRTSLLITAPHRVTGLFHIPYLSWFEALGPFRGK